MPHSRMKYVEATPATRKTETTSIDVASVVTT